MPAVEKRVDLRLKWVGRESPPRFFDKLRMGGLDNATQSRPLPWEIVTERNERVIRCFEAVG